MQQQDKYLKMLIQITGIFLHISVHHILTYRWLASGVKINGLDEANQNGVGYSNKQVSKPKSPWEHGGPPDAVVVVLAEYYMPATIVLLQSQE